MPCRDGSLTTSRRMVSQTVAYRALTQSNDRRRCSRKLLRRSEPTEAAEGATKRDEVEEFSITDGNRREEGSERLPLRPVGYTPFEYVSFTNNQMVHEVSIEVTPH